MIKYEQLPKNEGSDAPPDIKAITNDADCEMVALEEMLQKAEADGSQTFTNVQAATRDEISGNFEFVIPGDEVGDMIDLFWDIDHGELERFAEKLNEEAMKALEEAEAE